MGASTTGRRGLGSIRQCLAEGLCWRRERPVRLKPDAPVRRHAERRVVAPFQRRAPRFFRGFVCVLAAPRPSSRRQSLKDKKCAADLQSTGEAKTKDAIEEHGEVRRLCECAETLERLIKKVFASPGDDEADARQREPKACASRDDAPLGRTLGGLRQRGRPGQGYYAQSDTDFSDPDSDSEEKAAAKLGVTLGKTCETQNCGGCAVGRRGPAGLSVLCGPVRQRRGQVTAAQLHGILVFDVDDTRQRCCEEAAAPSSDGSLRRRLRGERQ